MSGRVSEQLGTGASFGRTRGGVSARRQAVAATTGAPTTGAPDSRLRTLPLDQLVPTRFNPRFNFGTEEELHEFGLKLKKKQLQPATAVTRDAYLLLWPEEEQRLGGAPYVIANGERRYRGSKTVGLTTLEVVVDDELARSRADFLDAVLSENNDREDLDPIERAIGIDTMTKELGGAGAVAEHYGKTKGWVSQQRSLLKLTPELQALISDGTMPVRVGREIAARPPAEQAAAWQAELRRRTEAQETPRPRKKKKEAAPGTAQTTRQQGSDQPGSPSGAPGFTAVNQSDTPINALQDGAPALPGQPRSREQRQDSPADGGEALAQAVHTIMRATEQDAGDIADVLGQNLPRDVLAALTVKLNAWL